VAGREVVQPEEAEESPAAAVDLMAALRASVERARQARGEEPPAPAAGEDDGAADGAANRPTPIKKAAAKKAAPAAKKAAPAKKAAAKKSA
jgi:DNA end-binding protein Ku